MNASTQNDAAARRMARLQTAQDEITAALAEGEASGDAEAFAHALHLSVADARTVLNRLVKAGQMTKDEGNLYWPVSK